ncbi:hypothetical protein O3G_MSEX009685 [Manduca sexta]|uniref:Lipocalin/cytosolic fatty-acid binding domain-containing protein n=1 Tax=Manduca sexta TaxID=7130 RepID=A0A921ZE74_MANSE|nr:hypothetical protein O3G_MSEX009685 [Manduca sexta]
MDQYLGLKYKLKSSENFEEYMSFIEIGLISRKTAISVSPVCELTRDDDGVYTYTMATTFKTMKFSFKLGEEFVEERADGVKVKSVMTLDGDKLIQVQIEDNGRKSTHVRHFTPELMTVVRLNIYII